MDVEKLLKPKLWGWRFVAFDLRFPNGQLVEYYLPPLELDLKPIKVCLCIHIYLYIWVGGWVGVLSIYVFSPLYFSVCFNVILSLTCVCESVFMSFLIEHRIESAPFFSIELLLNEPYCACLCVCACVARMTVTHKASPY